MPEEIPAPAQLSLGDSIAIVALVFSVVAFVVIPTWWLRSIFLIPATFGSAFLVFRSHWTHTWRPVTKATTSSILCLAILSLGILQIKEQLRSEKLWDQLVTKTYFGLHEFFQLIAGPWIIRCACVLAGMSLLLLFQIILRMAATKRLKRLGLAKQDKGFLDFKMQMEQSMDQLRQVTEATTQIVVQSTASMQTQTVKVRAVASSSTKEQMRIVADSAKAMDKYSHMLEMKGTELEEIGRRFAEGISGWLFWLRKNPSMDPSKQPLLPPLRTFILRIEENVSKTDELMGIHNIGRGVSQTMNAAIDARLSSLKKIRDANENIRSTCANSLRSFDTPEDAT
jgi:hypothetical protein